MSLCARIIDVEQRFMSDVPLPPYQITVVEIGRPLPKGSRSMGEMDCEQGGNGDGWR